MRGVECSHETQKALKVLKTFCTRAHVGSCHKSQLGTRDVEKPLDWRLMLVSRNAMIEMLHETKIEKPKRDEVEMKTQLFEDRDPWTLGDAGVRRCKF